MTNIFQPIYYISLPVFLLLVLFGLKKTHIMIKLRALKPTDIIAIIALTSTIFIALFTNRFSDLTGFLDKSVSLYSLIITLCLIVPANSLIAFGCKDYLERKEAISISFFVWYTLVLNYYTFSHLTNLNDSLAYFSIAYLIYYLSFYLTDLITKKKTVYLIILCLFAFGFLLYSAAPIHILLVLFRSLLFIILFFFFYRYFYKLKKLIKLVIIFSLYLVQLFL